MAQGLASIRGARAASNDRKPYSFRIRQYSAHVQFLRRIRYLAEEGRESFRGKNRQVVLHGVILYRMLDIKFIRENKDIVAAGAKKKRIQVDLNRLVELDDKRRELQATVDGKRAEQKKASTQT